MAMRGGRGVFGRGRGTPLGPPGSLGPLPAQTQAPNTYPTVENLPPIKPLTEAEEYLVKKSDEIRRAMRESPFYLQYKVQQKDVERYADRYKPVDRRICERRLADSEVDFIVFPMELKVKRLRSTGTRKGPLVAVPRVPPRRVKRVRIEDAPVTVDDLDELDRKPVDNDNDDEKEAGEEEKEGGGDDEDGEKNEDEYYDEEDMEEGTDYNTNYFDDGGDYGFDDDGGDDEGPSF
eukprot:Opistho-2@29661